MQTEEQSHKQEYTFSQDKIANEQRIRDRREKDSPGFAHITIVGWICRREKIRRKDDNFSF